ncbi:hypothetical protein G8770_07235 [Aestuariicella hydrocarbonica]|uniref:Uncharacterized protein n=1 Tax=Pseudomaricurvus hydrocarbonicus TaxID=1470433 RepID=A0A9E5MKG0_9GAMM|nr:hypothetical protein [Aestuariicella hydrocarbonica]NHO65332.1 hypothetical protein [Aestuariicella hydrocarbonica]
MTTPTHLQDSKELLSNEGFAVGTIWYHGTSSALLESILINGLKRSGDQAMKQAAKQTMATIGNSYTESVEPVFLTQSKELAYYWAKQTVRNRSVRIQGNESPVVIEITLPEDLQAGVKPDVGAASLLMLDEGEQFMAFVSGLYEVNGLEVPSIDLMKADRLDYLNKLGMAYYGNDIEAQYVQEVNA